MGRQESRQLSNIAGDTPRLIHCEHKRDVGIGSTQFLTDVVDRGAAFCSP
jgi:hypothetical protein